MSGGNPPIVNVTSLSVSSQGAWGTPSVFPPADEWSGDSFDDLEVAVVLSLGCDARVTRGELPEGDSDQKGYWGDALAEVPGDKWGSRLHLHDRGTTSDEEVAKAHRATRDALQWFVDDGVIAELTTEIVTRAPSKGAGAEIRIDMVRRKSDDPRTLFYDPLWHRLRG